MQDVLIRAHAVLLAGDVPDELRPWLYRLTRNRAIDEVRRARWGDEALGDEAAAARDDREDPEAVLRRKESLRRLVDDLADLPVRQRTALLARELDGQSPEQVAEQLGVSVAAAQMLATRARENLVKTRAARDADHADIRAALLDAHERGVRPSEHVLRHVARLRRLPRLPARHPPPVQAAAGAQPGARAAAARGPREARRRRWRQGRGRRRRRGARHRRDRRRRSCCRATPRRAGDPAPFRAQGRRAALAASPSRRPIRSRRTRRSSPRACASPARPAGRRRAPQRDARLPRRHARRRHAGARAAPAAELRPVEAARSRATRRAARIDFGRALPAALLRRHRRPACAAAPTPTARSSTTRACRAARRAAGPRLREQAYLYRSPGTTFVGTAFKGQPLSIQRRSASGRWALVVTDLRTQGWVKEAALCR